MHRRNSTFLDKMFEKFLTIIQFGDWHTIFKNILVQAFSYILSHFCKNRFLCLNKISKTALLRVEFFIVFKDDNFMLI